MSAMDKETSPQPEASVLIVNPRSGGGKAVRHGLVAECAARGVEPIVLGPDDDAAVVAAAAASGGAAVIGVAGGDGSQSAVAAVAAQHDVAFVCVPAGTRNHFAYDLGINRHDVVGALDAFVNGDERRVDLGCMNGRMFLNNASMGWYGKVVQSRAYRDAKLKTVLEMLPELIGPRAEPFSLRFSGPGGRRYTAVHLLLVSNNAYDLDHPSLDGSRDGIDHATLGVIAARIGLGKELVPFRSLGAVGDEFHGWTGWTVPTFRVDADGEVDLGLDGEAVKVAPPLLFESLPLALRVRVPAHRHGRRPLAQPAGPGRSETAPTRPPGAAAHDDQPAPGPR